MKVAISGKGGSGKTTIAGTLARLFAQAGHSVLAIDGDSNPNLGITLGLPADKLNDVQPLPSDLLVDVTNEAGERTAVLNDTVEGIANKYGMTTGDNVRLLAMKKIDHAGAG